MATCFSGLTTFNPADQKASFKLDKSNKSSNQNLELGLRQFLAPRINFEIQSFTANNGKNVVAFIIPAAKEEPAYFMGKAYVRVDSCKTDLKNYPAWVRPINVRKAIRNYQFKIFPNNTLLPAEVWKYDNRSILEALHNCIMHQDYTMNERIVVNEYADKLVFTNAGAFYDGAYDDYVDGRKTPKRYRNQFLANAMVNLKMVDSQGFGIHDMFQYQRDRFLPMPDYDHSSESHVILEIPGQVINRDYSETLMENGSLDLPTVVLLDRVQKGKPLTKEALKKLRDQKLVEGRVPNVIISRKVAGMTSRG